MICQRKRTNRVICCRNCAGCSTQCLRKKFQECVQTKRWPDRIHEDAILGKTVKVTRQRHVKFRELLEEGFFFLAVYVMG